MKLLPHFLLALAFTANSIASAAPAKTGASSSRPVAKKTPAKSKAANKTVNKTTAKTVNKAPPSRPAPARIDYAGEQVNFTDWKAVNDFADEVALRHGFPRDELRALFAQARFVDSAVQLVKPAPVGKPKNMNAVRRLMIEPVRINAGIRFWNEHADTLARAEAEFGVPADIIVGIIGIETVYGRNTGRFRVVDVLTTLGFAYPEAPNKAARMAFFRGELENTLLLARKLSIDPFSLLGSFAGAVGLPQFMPGSILAYAVDFDGDGAIDLRGSPRDAIGSVANFLVKHGWKREQNGPAVYQAIVSPGREWEKFLGQGLEAKFNAEQLRSAGVATTAPLPAARSYSLVDLHNGADVAEYWVSTNNFYAITHYNRSYYYAMSVLELGRAVQLAMAAGPAGTGRPSSSMESK